MSTILRGLLLAAVALPVSRAAQAQEYDDEIRLLAERSAVREAMAAVDALRDRTRAELIALTEIPAPPFQEATRAARYAEILRAAGPDTVWIDDEGNVLARRGGAGGGRTVVLSAHLDTVFPEGTDVTVRVRGDTLFAPGVADDTWGLMVVLTVLRAMEAGDVRTAADVLFVGTVGEEGLGDLRGVKHLFREGGPRIDAFISVDGARHDRIVHQALGSHRYRVTVRGPGGHSWGDFGIANTHHALSAATVHFVEVADLYTLSGPKTSYNVGRIGGGTSVNSVPFESWMEVDMRSVSQERLVTLDSLFQRALRRGVAEQNALRRQGDSLLLDVERVGDRPSGEIAWDTPFVQRAAAVTRYFGREPTSERSSTDANVPIAAGIPAITIGGGGIAEGAHSLGEWWLGHGAEIGIKRALLIVLAEAGMAGR